jgi:hypothetical protein
VVDAFPAPDALENGRFLIISLGWYQYVYGLADDLFGGLAE